MTAQQADQKKDRIVAQATAAAEEQVNAARTRTAEIAALAQQSGGLSRQMLMNRLYYDRVGPLLSKAGSVEAVDGEDSRVILPGPAQK